MDMYNLRQIPSEAKVQKYLRYAVFGTGNLLRTSGDLEGVRTGKLMPGRLICIFVGSCAGLQKMDSFGVLCRIVPACAIIKM